MTERIDCLFKIIDFSEQLGEIGSFPTVQLIISLGPMVGNHRHASQEILDSRNSHLCPCNLLFGRAVSSYPSHTPFYWAKVAMMVGTRSAEECHNKDLALQDCHNPTESTRKKQKKKAVEAPKGTGMAKALHEAPWRGISNKCAFHAPCGMSQSGVQSSVRDKQFYWNKVTIF